jgi:hypothetical protein
MNPTFVAFLVAVTVLASAGTATAAGDAENCARAKMKTAGKYVACRMGADAKAQSTGEPADYTKCDEGQAAAWAKTELKYGASCPTIGDQTGVQDSLADVTSCVAGDLAGTTGTCNVSTTAVSCPPSGVVHNGVCWVLGDVGLSCTNACLVNGLSYDDQTRTYAGSGAGTVGHCAFLMDELGTSGSMSIGIGGPPGGMGCWHTGSSRLVAMSDATTDQAYYASGQRVCACH